ncbi:hypothetical protein LPJ61_001706 [Coemansia biformis]|uniref:RFX-type winged-helix domain-containing protein n=1 Tax=Coemansia biformis TaxID=1286918 RepID=A0A9W7Y9J7_9FUNG|nr:hypothetical protein LPJ61_001706 [Coemansia biformis]
MQQGGAVAPRQRLASINDVAPRQSAVIPKAPVAKRQRTATPSNISEGQAEKQAFITEEYVGYLAGGPFNRFALALKSNLENEIDWACVRLVSATHQAPEGWNILQHAPFLIEAIVAVLERSRRELVAKRTRRRGSLVKAVKDMVLEDSGHGMVAERAHERAGLLATVLFNIAQVGENAVAMAQDPRVAIEITQWLQTFQVDDSGLCAVKTELLDVLDVLLPLAPPPPLDTQLTRWPVFGSRDSALLDPLALVESCLWAELVRILCTSRERKLVVGAARVMVQSIAWHPQLARSILDLPVPTWALMQQGGDVGQYVGELVNSRLAELALSPDIEVVAACFELLLNTVRLEAMARALDEELDAHALKAQTNGKGGNAGSVRRHRRPRGAGEAPDTPSGGESGSQTPVFGFRPMSRASSLAGAVAFVGETVLSEPSMLPDGLVSLVALVLQQWMSAACPPPQIPPPLALSSAAGTKSAMAAGIRSQAVARSQSAAGASAQTQQQQEQSGQSATNRPPSEPELREACTWVLLNYELHTPQQQQQQLPRQTPPYIALNDLFGRYMIAKQGQTVPRIGRALSLSEMVRVVAAVFPKATMQSVNLPNNRMLLGQQQQQQQSEVLVALNLKQKTQHIVPIPAVAVEGGQPKQQPASSGAAEPLNSNKPRKPNACCWADCEEGFESEEQALAHIAGHVSAADACRWRNCNRIPAGEIADSVQLEKWVARHVLTHGPFFKPTEEPDAADGPSGAGGSESDKQASARGLDDTAAREAKSQLLSTISPMLGGGKQSGLDQQQQQQQQQVLRLVLQGVGVVEQLQKWADRRAGQRGEQDRVRVWRCGDDVLERMAFVAAQVTPVAVYAARLLAVISKANVV